MAGIVGVAFVVANALGSQLQLALVPLVDGAIGHAQGFPIFQADGVDQRQALDLPGVEQCVASGEHAAGGVTEKHGLVKAEIFQQGVSVARQLLERVLVTVGFAGGAETDLVRGDDPVAGRAQSLDRLLPGGTAEVLAVHQHHALTIGRPAGLDVHIAHP